MDADDIAEPHRLEKQLPYLREHELDLVGSRVNGGCRRRISYMTPQPPCTPGKVAKVLKWNNCLAHPTGSDGKRFRRRATVRSHFAKTMTLKFVVLKGLSWEFVRMSRSVIAYPMKACHAAVSISSTSIKGA